MLIIISRNSFSQTWDKKSTEKRKIEICYKVCKGEEINQNDYSDLFEKGLLEIMIKNISDSKDAEQVSMIIDASRKYFIKKCDLYIALADSINKSQRLKNIKDSIVVPDNKK